MKRDQGRLKRVLELRESGLTFQAIGKQLFVSGKRAREIYEYAVEQRDRPPQWSDGLSRRVLNCLNHAGISSKEAVFRALDNGRLRPGGRCRNYGEKSHAELCAWLGFPASALAELESVE